MKKIFLILIPLFCIITTKAQVFSLVKDINPGTANSTPVSLTAVNGSLFFAANDGTHGAELWKSDGTGTGTVMIKDIYPGPNNSNIHYPVVVNGILFFAADDGTHGTELWKSDGTETGTVMVKEITPGPDGTPFNEFTGINGILFFAADDGINGVEFWKSDGTEAGTFMVKNIHPTTHSYPSRFTLLNGFVYFRAMDGIHGTVSFWKTDGTEAGTVLVKDFSGNPGGSQIGDILRVNSSLFIGVGGGFSPWTPQAEIWKSDGTEEGTVFVQGSLFPSWMRSAIGLLFFQGGGGPPFGTELWKSDGTLIGTEMVKDIWLGPSSSYPTDMIGINGQVYFLARNEIGNRLYRSDGTGAGTHMVVPGVAGAPVDINGIGYFSTNDGIHGSEPWRTDGTAAGTHMVQDVIPGAESSAALYFAAAGSKIFVTMVDPDNGRELWAANIPAQGPLPLTLSDFNARLSGINGLINWKTSSEQNTSHFEIERSLDGKHFTKIGIVAASGNSTEQKQYGFTDNNITSLHAPVIYYRLKMKDIDSKFTYSKTVAINISNHETVVMLYPNPVNENATLMIAARKKEHISYSLIDMNGRTVQQKNITINEGSNLINMETNSLPAGAYTIVLSGDYTNRTLKLAKR